MEGIDCLEDINFSNNKIRILHSEIFNKNAKLKKIDLSYNLISNLPENFLINNKNLEFLNLSNNYIISLIENNNQEFLINNS